MALHTSTKDLRVGRRTGTRINLHRMMRTRTSCDHLGVCAIRVCKFDGLCICGSRTTWQLQSVLATPSSRRCLEQVTCCPGPYKKLEEDDENGNADEDDVEVNMHSISIGGFTFLFAAGPYQMLEYSWAARIFGESPPFRVCCYAHTCSRIVA